MIYVTAILKIIVYVAVFGGIFGFIFYRFYLAWTRRWKFILKYDILKRRYDEETVAWCLKAVESGMYEPDIKKVLLINNISGERFYETIFLFRKIFLQVKGGAINNDGSKGYSGKVESTGFPKISK